MSYIRVIPRDLFNEANLLKCLGGLYIRLEMANISGAVLEHDGEAFEIVQNSDDGSIYAANVNLFINGEVVPLWRPMNSRQPWPLYADTGADTIEVFDDNGDLTPEMLAFLKQL